jgi:hypothetical protein
MGPSAILLSPTRPPMSFRPGLDVNLHHGVNDHDGRVPALQTTVIIFAEQYARIQCSRRDTSSSRRSDLRYHPLVATVSCCREAKAARYDDEMVLCAGNQWGIPI